MAVKQPKRRAARRAAPPPDPEVERVSRLLEEYGRRWRRWEGYGGFWQVPFGELRPTEGGVLYISPEGVRLSYFDRRVKRGDTGRREIRLVPPEGRWVAETLVEFERRYKFISHLLDEIWFWSEDLAWWLIVLEALRRYGPLFGKDFGIPKLKPKTGDVYRDFLEALYAIRVYWAVAAVSEDAAAPWAARPHNVEAMLHIPVEPPIPLTRAGRGGRSLTAALVMYTKSGVSLSLRDSAGRMVADVEPHYDGEGGGHSYMCVYGAALLMYLERKRGLLTRLAEAVERFAGTLERAAEEFPMAAELAALLFG